MKNEKYPSCIKCNTKLSPQNGRGWGKITDPNHDIEYIEFWLCPNCIAKFEHTKDLLSLKDSQRKKDIEDLSDFHSPITEGLIKIHNYLHKINDEVKG